MDPTDKATELVLQRRTCLTERTCTLLEVNLCLLAQAHRSRRCQSDTETDSRRYVGVQAGHSRADYRRCTARTRPVEQRIEITLAVRCAEIVGRSEGREEHRPGNQGWIDH